MSVSSKMPKWNEAKKEVTLKEIMSLHQSDLEVLESSNEKCQKHTKEYLRKSTRVDEENKKFSYWKFNWNDVERTGLWNLNHRNFKMLTQ